MNEASSYVRIGPAETMLANEDAARAEFAASCAIVCRNALDPVIGARLAETCARATFVPDHVGGMGHRWAEQPPIAGTAISVLLRRAPLFRWLERVTGCGPITSVEGRVAQTHALASDGIEWHDDMVSRSIRRLGITMALDSPPYEGGLFELRPVGGETVLRFKHDTVGTVLIFQVSLDMQHRLCAVTSGGPRQVFAGWFLG